MKIESKVYVSCIANFSNQDIEFNEKGVAEISDELGQKVIKDFETIVWEEGREPKKVGVINQIVDSKEVAILKKENEKLKVIIIDKDKDIATLKNNEQVWRDAYATLEASIKKGEPFIEVKDTVTKLVNEVNEKNEFVVPEGMQEVYDEMNSKQFNALKKWVKETYEKTDEDLKGIKGKESLIQFVFEICLK